MMQRVPIENLTPGMTLAKPVANAAGLVVVAEGMVLDESLIARLQRMGTLAVHVAGCSAGADAKTLAELEQELDHRFRKVAADPIQSRIREAVRRHLRASRGTEAGE
jgi:hypothetical protein